MIESHAPDHPQSTSHAGYYLVLYYFPDQPRLVCLLGQMHTRIYV